MEVGVFFWGLTFFYVSLLLHMPPLRNPRSTSLVHMCIIDYHTRSRLGFLSHIMETKDTCLVAAWWVCFQIVAGVVGLLLGQLSHRLHSLIPRQPLSTFYTMEAGLNTLYVILVVKSVQLLFYHNFCGNQRANKKKVSTKWVRRHFQNKNIMNN